MGQTFPIRLHSAESCLCSTWPAGLELAFLAFEDEPMGSRMAEVAVPEDERGVGLDHFERMFASPGSGHPDYITATSSVVETFTVGMTSLPAVRDAQERCRRREYQVGLGEYDVD